MGSETRIYEFPSRKYRSIEVGSHISKWETQNSASTPTSDLEIRVGKYEFPSPVECSKRDGAKRIQTEIVIKDLNCDILKDAARMDCDSGNSQHLVSCMDRDLA